MQPIEQHVVALIQEYDAMSSNTERGEARGVAIQEQIKLIGATAAFFGGTDGMDRLHDAAEGLVGRDNSIGYWLNKLWDGIGGWWA